MSLPTFRAGVVSDLHLEHDPRFAVDAAGVDVLLALGDLLGGEQDATGVEYLAQVAPDVPVLYVPGNHEFEGHSLVDGVARLRKRAKGTNVQVLYRNAVDFGGVRLLGATLWSGFDLFGAAHRRKCQDEAQASLYDFKLILGRNGRPILPSAVREEHLKDVAWLTQQLAKDPEVPKVLLTHFAPAAGSLIQAFSKELLAAYWVNPCEALVKKAMLALHGHTHASFDYHLQAAGPGRGRVIANAKGFTYALRLADTPEAERPALLEKFPALATEPEIEVEENPAFRNPLRLELSPSDGRVTVLP